jgi:hypothetical protein
MAETPDIAVYLPVELLDDFSEVLRVGLQRSKISPEAKKSLGSWWEAEKEFLTVEENK